MQVADDTITISRTQFDRLRRDSEMLSDIRAYDAAMAADEESFPAEVAVRLIAGESPLSVFREYRQLSVAELSRRSGVHRAQISDIEDGKGSGSTTTLKKLADALDLDLDDLV